jgi:hypothetical protein
MMRIMERKEAKANQRNTGPVTRRRVVAGTYLAYGFGGLVGYWP